MEAISNQDKDLHTDAVQFMQCSDAKNLIGEIFGEDIHQYMLYDLTRAYVPYKDRKPYDNSKISWRGNLEDGVDRGDNEYYCPTGFMKIPIKLPKAENPQDFDSRTQGWSICYHGTKKQFILPILEKGLKGSFGCWIEQTEKAVYLSPSIEYSSHPRYSEWFYINGGFYQVIFQCRTKQKSKLIHQSETLIMKSLDYQIDPRYQNNDNFEWVCKLNNNQIYADTNQLVITGLLIRKSLNPYNMKQVSWWIMPHLLYWNCSPDFLSIMNATCWEVQNSQDGYAFLQQQKIQSFLFRNCTCFCCTRNVAVPQILVQL